MIVKPAIQLPTGRLVATPICNDIGNGSFAESASGWSAINSTVTWNASGGPGNTGTWVRVTSTASSGEADIRKFPSTGVIETGYLYWLTGWFRGDGVAFPRVVLSGGDLPYFVGTASTDWQPINLIDFVNSGDRVMRLALRDFGIGNYCDFADIQLHRYSLT